MSKDNKIILGVAGDIGSFSEEAGRLYERNSQQHFVFDYLIDMEGVLAAVENYTIDLGILPVVNLHGGLVKMAFDAMGKHPFQLVDELWLNVNQCLLVKPEVTVEQINTIVSHSQALAQCREYLQKNFGQAKLKEWQDTAKAAKELSENSLPATTAVIASAQAAQHYSLKIIAQNIQDRDPNLTAFIIVKAREVL